MLTWTQIDRSLANLLALYDRYIIDRNIMKTAPTELTWHRSQTGITRGEFYHNEYTRLLNGRDFSLLFKDSSFVQVYYLLDDAGLRLGRLAYYPIPEDLRVRSPDVVDVMAFGEFDDRLEELEVYSNTSHFRYDFDRAARTHSPSHIQFGAVDELRVTSHKVLLPFLFVDAIARALNAEMHSEVLTAALHTAALGYDRNVLGAQRPGYDDSHWKLALG